MSGRTPNVPQSGPAQSEIIEQCVDYAQSMAAYHAGFKGDPTGKFEYAGASAPLGKKQLRKANRALTRLIALSPIGKGTTAPPLSRDELQAKAGVLCVMTASIGDCAPEPMEETFLRFFALEIESYFKEGQQ